ncbi:hypothetical protein SAMN06272781_1034 [Streptomyces sp. 1222.2]|uniref:cinnamyl alcohol dehydrogenase n=1 Tax=Streptomyces sp. 1222.2 TaxID=1938833 RepID=UPI000BDD6696|nr:cinnamyl alcohol dehydrogenase [Streptomyces sp. 1222.2]SOD67408.1 hypothetical protein SAMN06272781_1034 [Streptomyces sp. 1222.2]
MKRRTVLRAGAGLLAGGTVAAAPAADPTAVPTTPPTAVRTADPTDGWTRTAFTYSWHKPWNLDLSDRHSHTGGVHRVWVYATDEPFEQGSSTGPRTEMRWKNDYTTGDRMWDADVYLPAGTDRASFVQILRTRRPSGTPATDIMLNVHDTDGGTVRRYDGTVLKTGAYDTWFNVKIAHEASSGTGTVKVYLDNSLVLTVADRGPATRYFKNGVYHHGSGRAEARFRDITHWTR